jgi:DivIVA domain-containing protein
MTPDDIRSQRFAVQLVRGFRPDEVSGFLLDVADAYEDLQMMNASLMERLKALEAEVQLCSAPPLSSARAGQSLRDAEAQVESVAKAARAPEAAASGHIEMLRAAALREVEALLHDTQAQAHTVIEGAKEREAAVVRDAETAKARLQIEADSLLAGAIAKADSLMADARDQEATIRAEIERLIQSRLQLVDDIRGTLDTYHQWLATVDPRGRGRGWRDGELSNCDDHDAVDSSHEARVG